MSDKPPVPDKAQEQYYPPPPPGPPPSDQQQQQPVYEAPSSDLPPAYNTGEQQAPPPEKAPLPQQTAGESSQQTFPPPPAGPPPTQQQQYAPSQSDGSNDPKAFYKESDIYEGDPPSLPGPRPTGAQSSAAAGAIPSYNPANPQFAPPPGQQQSQQSYNQPPAASGAYPPAGAGAGAGVTPNHHAVGQDGHRSWGSLLTEMGHKAAAPINALANKLGSQSFLPTSLDKESEKAANILRSFCSKSTLFSPVWRSVY